VGRGLLGKRGEEANGVGEVKGIGWRRVEEEDEVVRGWGEGM